MSIRSKWINFQQKRLQKLREKAARQKEKYDVALAIHPHRGISTSGLFKTQDKSNDANRKLRLAEEKNMARILKRVK